jgi:PDZ domain-containing protein
MRTLLIGTVLVIILGVGSLVLRVPYVVLSPGPTINTLSTDSGTDIIAISGHQVAPTSGHLNLTTVSVNTQNSTVIGAIEGWLAHDQVVVPHDSVYPPGKTEQQTNEQDHQDFIQSQDSAVAAAACQLKYPHGIAVLSVADTSLNKTVLKPLDRFVSVNGAPTNDDTALRAELATLSAGQKVPVVVIRGGTKTTLTVTLGPPASGSKTPQLGITLQQGCLLPFQVTLSLSDIGGPSAGLMFALGIIDKISSDDLTHGKFIAGTGTIDPDGNVGEIGGIQLKMLGARRAGATVFLAPDTNCPDVRGNIPAGLDVIKVSTLSGAISALDALNAGQTNNLPHC